MTVLIVLLAVLLLLALLPVGARLQYDGKLLLRIRLGPVLLTLLPKKPKSIRQQEKQRLKAQEKKAQAEKRKAAAAAKKLRTPVQPEKTLQEKLAALKPFAALAIRYFGSLRRALLVRELTVRVTVAGNDAAKTARLTGTAWAAIGSSVPLLRQTFRIRRQQLQVTPDFVGERSEVYACLHVQFLLGSLVAITVKAACKALGIFFRQKQQQMKQQGKAAIS